MLYTKIKRQNKRVKMPVFQNQHFKNTKFTTKSFLSKKLLKNKRKTRFSVEGKYKKYLAPSRNAFSRFISRIMECKEELNDKGYDSTNLIETLKTNDIAPIIDIRNMWKSGEKTKITLSFVIYMTMAKAKIAEGLKSNLCKKYA